MNRWRWILLIFELVLFVVILYLPQVDLPDFTVHGGTAPVVAKAKLSAVPVLAAAHVPTQPDLLPNAQEMVGNSENPAPIVVSHSLLSFLCSFLC